MLILLTRKSLSSSDQLHFELHCISKRIYPTNFMYESNIISVTTSYLRYSIQCMQNTHQPGVIGPLYR